MATRTNKLKQLNLNPLSVAKYFYEKGVKDMALSQRLIYLLFLEMLKKENVILFVEEWQAWPHGSVIEPVFDKMHDNRHHLAKLFKSVKDLNNEVVLNYADKIFKKYHNTEPYLIFQKAQNKPWKDARKPLKSERETVNIELANLIKFTDGNGKRTRAI